MLEPTAAPRELTFSSLERTALLPERCSHLAETAIHPVAFRIGSTPCAVRFSEARSAADFLERYGDLPASTAPALAPAVTLFVVRDGSKTYFWAEPSSVWCWPDGPIEPDLVGFFADAVLHHEFMRAAPAVAFHAAVLALDGSCAAVSGTTTAGKTTTAVACARQGLRFYSDERCIIEDRRVVPFLRRLTLRAGGRTALLADEPQHNPFTAQLTAWEGRGEVAVRPSHLFGSDAIGGPPVRLRCMFVIDGYAESPAVTPTTAVAAAPALVLSLSSGAPALDRFASLLAALRGVDVYRLTLGRPAATALAIREVLQRAGSAGRS